MEGIERVVAEVEIVLVELRKQEIELVLKEKLKEVAEVIALVLERK